MRCDSFFMDVRKDNLASTFCALQTIIVFGKNYIHICIRYLVCQHHARNKKVVLWGDCLQTHEICQLYENNSTQLRIASLPDDILTRKTPVVFFCVYKTQSCDLQDYHCSFRCEIFGLFLLSFPQNERKIY